MGNPSMSEIVRQSEERMRRAREVIEASRRADQLREIPTPRSLAILAREAARTRRVEQEEAERLRQEEAERLRDEASRATLVRENRLKAATVELRRRYKQLFGEDGEIDNIERFTKIVKDVLGANIGKDQIAELFAFFMYTHQEHNREKKRQAYEDSKRYSYSEKGESDLYEMLRKREEENNARDETQHEEADDEDGGQYFKVHPDDEEAYDDKGYQPFKVHPDDEGGPQEFFVDEDGPQESFVDEGGPQQFFVEVMNPESDADDSNEVPGLPAPPAKSPKEYPELVMVKVPVGPLKYNGLRLLNTSPIDPIVRPTTDGPQLAFASLLGFVMWLAFQSSAEEGVSPESTIANHKFVPGSQTATKLPKTRSVVSDVFGTSKRCIA